MEQISYTIDEAARRLNIDVQYIYQQAIEGQVRLGVNARGWWGSWYPISEETGKLENTNVGPCDIDENGIRTYAHEMPGAIIKIREVYISQFWYLEHSELYNLLASRDKKMRDIALYEPLDINYLVNEYPDCFTRKGFFWVQKEHKGQKQDRMVGLENLRILDEDLALFDSLKNGKQKPLKRQLQRETVLGELIAEQGIDKLRPLGRQGVWEELGSMNKEIFPLLSKKAVDKFFDDQYLIAFKA